MVEGLIREGRSLEETPTWSVATVTTVMVFVCLFAERSIYRFGKWLKKTKRKALFASLEKIKEGGFLKFASTHLSSVANSTFVQKMITAKTGECYSMSSNATDIPPKGVVYTLSHICGEGREPFVSAEGLGQLHRFLFVLGITHVLYSCITVGLSMSKIYSWRKWEVQAGVVAAEGLGQLHRFLFVLGITHVLYSCITVGLSMSKIYSWRKWEVQAGVVAEANALAKNKVMRRQTTFALHHASHPWSRSRVLIWMLCFLKQFRISVRKSDYMALRLGFITNHKLPPSYNFHKYMVRSMEDEFYGIVGISWPLWGYAILCIFINIHGLNIYFWLSFIPAILVMLVGTKLQRVVSLLALEIAEQRGPSNGTEVKPRDELFWFGKPEILLRLIQFISFQNAFEMATFIWSLWGLEERSCFMKNHAMIITRLISGLLVQFWCSYSTVPLNVIVTTMGSRLKKALIAESVRDSLHSWCKRVKARSKATNSVTTRSTCSLDERDEIITVGSGTLSQCSSTGSLSHLDANEVVDQECGPQNSNPTEQDYSFRHMQHPDDDDVVEDNVAEGMEEGKGESTLHELFQKT